MGTITRRTKAKRTKTKTLSEEDKDEDPNRNGNNEVEIMKRMMMQVEGMEIDEKLTEEDEKDYMLHMLAACGPSGLIEHYLLQDHDVNSTIICRNRK